MELNKIQLRLKSINFISIVWFLFVLQMVAGNVAKHSIYYQISGGLFILSSIIYLVKNLGFRWEKQYFMDLAAKNKYYIIFFCFIIYNALLIFLGNTANFSNSFGMLKTISINFILYVLIFNFLMLENHREKLIKLYVNAMVISNIIILFIFRESVMAGERLAFSWGNRVSSYQLFGVEVVTAGSNGIAYYSGVALILSVYIFLKLKDKIKYLYLSYILLFILTILTTGSRKGMLIIATGLIILPLLITKNSRKFKLIYGVSAFFAGVISLVLTQTIPFLYDMIGERIARIFLSIFTGEVIDVSMDTRITLVDSALNLISSNPIFGYGLDAFRVLGPWGIVTDNNYLDILVSSGIIGLLIFYTYAVFVIYDFITIKEKSDLVKIFFLIFCLNLVLDFFSVTYFERNFGFVNAMLFFVLMSEKGTKKEGKSLGIKKNLRKFISRLWHLELVQTFVPDRFYIKMQFRNFIGKELDLDNPKTFNEKIQWLKLYDRNPNYSKFVDKYEVRKYIAETIGEDHLIPLLGVYNSFDEIDFDQLPDQFVLKPTHTSGDIFICKDKSKINYPELKKMVNKWMKRKYYFEHREWPYKNIKPRIIAEKFMVDESGYDLKDYKIFCFNGEPKCLFVASERHSESGMKMDFYDMDWNLMPFERKYPRSGIKIPKPKSFEQMVSFAKLLSMDFPFVRVDFYDINGHLYFGELTFYPGSGLEEFTPEEYDYLLGSWLKLPEKPNES